MGRGPSVCRDVEGREIDRYDLTLIVIFHVA